jgi:hypothetical protein
MRLRFSNTVRIGKVREGKGQMSAIKQNVEAQRKRGHQLLSSPALSLVYAP